MWQSWFHYHGTGSVYINNHITVEHFCAIASADKRNIVNADRSTAGNPHGEYK
jgi:hypothetical protein